MIREDLLHRWNISPATHLATSYILFHLTQLGLSYEYIRGGAPATDIAAHLRQMGPVFWSYREFVRNIVIKENLEGRTTSLADLQLEGVAGIEQEMRIDEIELNVINLRQAAMAREIDLETIATLLCNIHILVEGSHASEKWRTRFRLVK